MKTVTICGSMMFQKQMQEIAFSLETQRGMNVLQCVYDSGHGVAAGEKAALAAAHRRKIELSDAIYVVDIQGYIGHSVSEEIAFAKALGKEIIYHSEFENISGE